MLYILHVTLHVSMVHITVLCRHFHIIAIQVTVNCDMFLAVMCHSFLNKVCCTNFEFLKYIIISSSWCNRT